MEDGHIIEFMMEQTAQHMEELPQVTLRHPGKDISVPEALLRLCSPVLDGILRDAAEPEKGGNKILTIDDVSLEVLEAFVAMVTMSSYAPTDQTLTTEEIAKRAELLMPLIHKYDCKGLLSRLRDAVNLRPEVSSIAAMLKYDSDVPWMGKDTLGCLAANLLHGKGYEGQGDGGLHRPNLGSGCDLGWQQALESFRQKLNRYPPSVAVDLLFYVSTLLLAGKSWRELIGDAVRGVEIHVKFWSQYVAMGKSHLHVSHYLDEHWD